MGVGHLKTGDHQPDPRWGEDLLLRTSDGVCHPHEVRRCVRFKIGPLVNLELRYDQRVARCEGTHVEETHTHLVLP